MYDCNNSSQCTDCVCVCVCVCVLSVCVCVCVCMHRVYADIVRQLVLWDIHTDKGGSFRFGGHYIVPNWNYCLQN